MKTKLTSVTYLGYTAMDRHFSSVMLPWLIKEIQKTGTTQKLSLVIEDGFLKAFDVDFEPVFVHCLVDIVRVSQVPGQPSQLFYILYNEAESLLNCFLFQVNNVNDVSDLFTQMREPSPASSSPHGSRGSLSGGVMKNLSFQSTTSGETPWASGPAMSLPHNARINLSNESPLVRSSSNASTLTSLCADLSPSDSHFFEVLYIGKVRISQRKVPDSLIDDALNKFAQHEAEKQRNIELRRHSLLSSSTSEYSVSPEKQLPETDFKQTSLPNTNSSLEPDKDIKNSLTNQSAAQKATTNQNDAEIEDEFDIFTKERSSKNGTKISKPTNVPLEPQILVLNINNINNLTPLHEDDEKHETVPANEPKTDANPFLPNSHETSPAKDEKTQMKFGEYNRKPKFVRSNTGVDGSQLKRNSVPDNKPFLRDRSASIGTISVKTPISQLIDQNRTMLFQVGRTELRLISPDRKQILLHRAFKDVSSCVRGKHCAEHFGFVCREGGEQFACYVFKCESEEVALETVNAIKQAFVAHAELVKKSREKSPNLTCEHCPMLWYHRLCHDIEGMYEKKSHASILRRIEQLPDDEQEQLITKYQGGTNHMYEVSEHIAFLMMLLRAHCEAKQLRHVHDTAENRSEFLNQYLGGSTIFMKAKRSLSSGFDHLLKRKASRDDLHLNTGQLKKEMSPLGSPPVQSQALQPPEVVRSKSVSPATPGDCPPSPTSTSANQSLAEPEEETLDPPSTSPMMDIFLKVGDSRPAPPQPGEEDATWRQEIYNKVAKTEPEGDLSTKALLNLQDSRPSGKRSKEQLRQLWKMAIDQTILLVRMENENAKLKQSEETSAVRRIKLEYTELASPDAGVVLMWDNLLSARRNSDHPNKLDHHMLAQAVIQGVPRMYRGNIWYFLAEQACLRSAPPDAKLYPNYNTPYRKLISGLTKHQHAILIDLGRTFPQHEYFSSPLGPGQLALYNILKAYSLLDPDVGYCQGLSFVAGVLLLHTDEAEAFILLRHLMFRRGLRKQYLPDMSALQVQLYQMSRLVREHAPALHEHLHRLDVSAALYAAPWMLTLFTTNFPMGFVVRVFDLIFLESTEVMFTVSLALLLLHKDGLMLCETCEEAAEYLKHKLPDMDKNMYEKVMKKVLSLDITRQLAEYAVEYTVLREEMPRVATLTETNRKLTADNRRMSDELDSAMEAITNYQTSQARLELHKKTMEQQLALLSRYLSVTHKQELPTEIKKIVHTYNKKQSFGAKIFSKHQEEDDPKNNFKTGVSAPNLFAKITKEEVINAMNKNERDKQSPENDRKHFMMKKSQSVHSGLIANQKSNSLKVVDENCEMEKSNESNFRRDSLILENLKELSKKTTGYSNTQQIQQERLFEKQLKLNFDENLKKSDDKLLPSSYLDDLSIFQSKKSMSLNITPKEKIEKCKLNDSGVGTPMTPDIDKKLSIDSKDDTMSLISHPLSDCDIDIKFESTTLKQIRPFNKNH